MEKKFIDGKEIGRAEGKAEVVKKMIKKGFSLEDIAECTSLTVAEIKRIAEVF